METTLRKFLYKMIYYIGDIKMQHVKIVAPDIISEVSSLLELKF